MRTTTPLAPTIGLLWALSGAFVLLEPFGAAVAWSDAKQFEVVVDHARYVLYGLPGTLALVLGAVVLLRAGGLAARLALALGAVSAAGIAAALVPLHMGPLVLGTVLLGLAAWRAAWRAPAGPARWRLAVLGAATAAFLPVWPVVLALGWLPPAGGAAAIALIGATWARLGRLPVVAATA